MTEDAVTNPVIEQRADIEAQTAGLTLCGLLLRTAEDYGDLPAYSDRDGDAAWQTLTWRQFRDQALRLAAGLVRLGLKPGERVALMLPNRMEHVLADQAVLHAGGVPVTFYATLAPDQIRYVAADCDVRMFSLYLAIYSAGHSYFCHVTTDLVKVVGEVKPTAFFGVPRVWEKIQAGLHALLTLEQDEAKKAAAAAAMETGREYVLSCQYGNTTSEELAARLAA